MYKLFSILCILFIFQVSIFAQETNQNDLSKIDVDELSDSQIKALITKAEESGMTESQLIGAAQMRGMPDTEVEKLKERVQKLKGSGLKSDESDVSTKRSRTYKKQLKSKEDLFKNSDKLSNETDIFSTLQEEPEKEIKPEEKVFGYSLFNQEKLTFEPSLNIPTPENYQFGAGDEIIIDIWGASQKTYKEEITPEGTIIIKNLGPILISGLTVKEATAKLKTELVKIYAGLQGSNPNTFYKVSLGNIRSIRVNIVGDVYKPGTYTLPSLASLFHALYSAGGPSYNGTLRNIKIIRGNKPIADVDLYDFLLNGTQNNNIRLQDQDIIFIPPYQTRVEIKGEIKKPFLYDIKPSETLKDLINFSGGFTGKAYTYRLKLMRKTGRENRIYDLSHQEADTFHLANGDEITIDSVLTRFENLVEIKGAVYRPGKFAIDGKLTLKQLIEKADGLKGDAFKNRAVIYRTKEDYTIEAISLNISALMNGEEDIELKREDVVFIPSIFDLKEEYFVHIEGDVLYPDDYPYTANTTIEDLILQAGGLKESASFARLEVARRLKNPNALTTTDQVAEIFQFSISEDLKLSDEASKFTLMPFDRVYVRRSPGYEKQSTITIDGEVIFPGEYSISNKKERISDIIKRAGGVTPEAFPKGARLLRTDSLKFSPDKIDKSTYTIGIDLAKILANPHSKYDLYLQGSDMIIIPKELQTVKLTGKVLSPVSIRYDRRFKFRSYINNAGGFSYDADKRKSYIIYANGGIDRTRKIVFFNSYPKVEPGAEIIVPQREPRKKLSIAEVIGMTSTMASVALVVVTIISITKQ